MIPVFRESHITIGPRPVWRELTALSWLVIALALAWGCGGLALTWLWMRFGR